MLDRRKFFKLFTAGSAGLSVAGKLALAEDITNWMLSPSKTIFIPPEPIIVVPPVETWAKIELLPQYLSHDGMWYTK